MKHIFRILYKLFFTLKNYYKKQIIPWIVLVGDDNGNNFPDLVLDVPPGDCVIEEMEFAFLLEGVVLRDLRRLVSRGADRGFNFNGCNIQSNNIVKV